jgi:uncharacterized protein YwqG
MRHTHALAMLALAVLAAGAAVVTGKPGLGQAMPSSPRPAQPARPSGLLPRHRPLLDALRTPALKLAHSRDQRTSRLGGAPNLPPSLEWPQWKGKPLSFLAQLDLAEIPKPALTEGLPDHGVLYFFYSVDQETWGFDPKDRGSWRVLYAESARAAPLARVPSTLPPHGRFKQVSLRFERVLVYPDAQTTRVQKLNLSDDDFDAYAELQASVFGRSPMHQLLGTATAIQDPDMEREAQLASNGLYLGNEKVDRKREAALAAGIKDWMLLLQLDSDDAADMMWGDAGRLYFWIRKQDLRARDFSRTWMILQCY